MTLVKSILVNIDFIGVTYKSMDAGFLTGICLTETKGTVSMSISMNSLSFDNSSSYPVPQTLLIGGQYTGHDT